ncbi:hypothetical protein JKP88DRAFT_352986 [Tribonema minus]|uniref:Uncharacterized protein n=1 Tax=Tribonema minus TaxID=303371 RepID=A0A836CKC0_9STRA|nr:hypothetical protein JKP88DRAFT_352986 [Tribonema minus]
MDGSMEGVSWNPDVTVNVMMHRRLQRDLLGTYRKDEFVQRWGKRVLCLMVVLSTLGADTNADASAKDKLVVVLLAAAALAVISVLFHLFSLVLVWWYLAWMLIFVLTDDIYAMFRAPESLSEDDAELRLTVLLTALVLSVGTIVTMILRNLYYPWAVANGKLGQRWFGLRAAGPGAPDEVLYLSLPRRLLQGMPVALEAVQKRMQGRYVFYTDFIDVQPSPPMSALAGAVCPTPAAAARRGAPTAPASEGTGWRRVSYAGGVNRTGWRHLSYAGGVDAQGRSHGAGQWSNDTYRTGWRRVSYAGGVDGEGRPHGAGQWSDSGPHGEVLQGWWHHGRPTAPFRSLETRTGYAFHAMRIAVATNRQEVETSLRGLRFWPRHCSAEGAVYRVLSVECSVSGMFFNITAPPPNVPGALWCAWKMLSPIDGILKKKYYPAGGITFHDCGAAGSSAKARSAPVAGGDLGSGSSAQKPDSAAAPARTAEAARLKLGLRAMSIINAHNARILQVGMRVASGPPKEAEALVYIHGFSTTIAFAAGAIAQYIHGFSTTIAFAAGAIAQLFTLGDFPPHILPFIFSWPAGQLLSYSLAKTRGATSERTVQDYLQLMRDIADAGITKVHIMTHSMGTRVLMEACWHFDELMKPLGEKTNVRESVSESAPGQRPLLKLETVAMLNPDFEEYSFSRPGGTFDQLRRFCPVITVYADAKDGALRVGSIINWGASLGRAGIARPGHTTKPQHGMKLGNFNLPDLPVLKGSRPPLHAPQPQHDPSPGLLGDSAAAAAEEGGDGLVAGVFNLKKPGGDSSASPNQADAEQMDHINGLLRAGGAEGQTAAVAAAVADVHRVEGGEAKGKAGGELQVAATTDAQMVPGCGFGGRMAQDGQPSTADADSWLDMDVIDTTWLDNNIHDMRHTFFNINPTIVDDLRELLVYHRRASHRDQVAPNVVKNP